MKYYFPVSVSFVDSDMANPAMSAVGVRADINVHTPQCPLIAKSGHRSDSPCTAQR
jgi:hypothetical protein